MQPVRARAFCSRATARAPPHAAAHRAIADETTAALGPACARLPAAARAHGRISPPGLAHNTARREEHPRGTRGARTPPRTRTHNRQALLEPAVTRLEHQSLWAAHGSLKPPKPVMSHPRRPSRAQSMTSTTSEAEMLAGQAVTADEADEESNNERQVRAMGVRRARGSARAAVAGTQPSRRGAARGRTQVRTLLRLIAERPDDWHQAEGEEPAPEATRRSAASLPRAARRPPPKSPTAGAAKDAVRGDVDALAMHCLPLIIAGTRVRGACAHVVCVRGAHGRAQRRPCVRVAKSCTASRSRTGPSRFDRCASAVAAAAAAHGVRRGTTRRGSGRGRRSAPAARASRGRALFPFSFFAFSLARVQQQ